MQNDPFRIPTDDEIAIAERKLGITFHNDYRCFLKSGSDVANAIFEAAVILPDAGRLDIFEMARIAWEIIGVPRDLLPFIEDNGDYFCISKTGEVIYWSHNGSSNEKWPNMSAWHNQVCINLE
ncbi:SMI1/KNR4 family protein [Aeromonas jandaei]|uniref:SMI1/KNR4 family protein n=1 Tax=Aeromonas TaxID=642 RepID=UPI00191F7345|nr:MULTISPECIES: SMI1/KNR4 family protein [Aeromonas]MBL0611245.1 SMI1/KNR4 family protein [Aeromonas jandaei]QXC38036.1 SMI1/KNR4 family protein [Aeromonas sp. FDAARGOS 1410]